MPPPFPPLLWPLPDGGASDIARGARGALAEGAPQRRACTGGMGAARTTSAYWHGGPRSIQHGIAVGHVVLCWGFASKQALHHRTYVSTHPVGAMNFHSQVVFFMGQRPEKKHGITDQRRQVSALLWRQKCVRMWGRFPDRKRVCQISPPIVRGGISLTGSWFMKRPRRLAPTWC